MSFVVKSWDHRTAEEAEEEREHLNIAKETAVEFI